MEVVAELAANGPWHEPWESDPQWRSIEQRLNIDLVPLSPTAGTTIERENRISWSRSPQGEWRASMIVVVPKSTTSKVAIRGTRQFDDHAIARLWWTWWFIGGLATWLSSQAWQSASRWIAARRSPLIIISDSSAESPSPTIVTDSQQVAEAWRDRLRTILDSLREGVLVVDSAGRVALANSALYQQLDLSADQLEGRSLVEAVRIPRVVELLEHVLASRDVGPQRCELTSGKRTLAIAASALVVRDQPSGALLTAVDISSVQQSELARREFIAGASHELKTPLAAIRAYTETLQAIGGDDPMATHKFLGNILDQADRMNRLVSSMMQLARAESGEMKLKLERIDAAAAIRPSIEAAIGMAQPKGQTVLTQLPDAQLLVMADRDALQTIASNLLSNAIRYTPEGGRIEIRLSLETPAGPQLAKPSANHGSKAANTQQAVCLRVTDTGIGIAAADQSRIFERFYRVQKDRALDSGGTGLGLAIVKQLTEVLGGSVTVSSRPGEGTRFEIWLPAVGFTQSSS